MTRPIYKLLEKIFIPKPMELRKTTMGRISFLEFLDLYLEEHPDLQVDRIELLKAYEQGKLDPTASSLERYLK